jgi:putative DNA primase/helicase
MFRPERDDGTKRGQQTLDERAEQAMSARTGSGDTKPYPASELAMTRGCDLKPEAIQWVWPGYLAAGKLHILGGAPSTGKTTIAMSWGGTVSNGGNWPDGSTSPLGNVVVWSGEDDAADTLVPRLSLSGADLSRVYFVGDVTDGNGKRAFDPARDMKPLADKLAEIGNVRLLIVDPIVSAIAGDSHKNAEVRRGLQPLVDLAGQMRCALVGITHFSKGTGGRDPVERITGSLAFGALARVVLVAARHQEEGDDGRTIRVLLRAKSNIGMDDGGFEYDLQQGEMTDHPGIVSSFVQWGDPVEGAARELLATADATGDDGEGGTLGDAERFLSDLLSDGPIPTKTIKADADGAGYSWATIRRAQKSLGVDASKSGMKSGWQWSLPRRCSINTEDVQQNNVSTFGEFEHLRSDTGTLDAVNEDAQDAQQKVLGTFGNVEHLADDAGVEF